MTATGTWRGNPKYAWCAVPREPLLPPGASADEAEAAVRAQASRCIQCPEPACETACPLGNRIAEWLALAAQGRFLEAAEASAATSCMPELCARACTASQRLCEEACLLQAHTDPVAIALVEQFVNEFAFAHGAVEPVPAMPNGLRVAVVGSGPGAIACADDLAQRGYEVVVFEPTTTPGVLLVNGSFGVKLPGELVARRIQVLARRGVKFRLGVELGRDVSLDALREEFDALFLSLGSQPAPTATPARAASASAIPAIPGIFIGGDAVGHPAQLVHAMRDGRLAADGIDRYLHGQATA